MDFFKLLNWIQRLGSVWHQHFKLLLESHASPRNLPTSPDMITGHLVCAQGPLPGVFTTRNSAFIRKWRNVACFSSPGGVEPKSCTTLQGKIVSSMSQSEKAHLSRLAIVTASELIYLFPWINLHILLSLQTKTKAFD